MERPVKPPKPNDACWCGSGRKYKKCHLGDDEVLKAPPPASKRIRPGRVSPRREVPAHIPRPDYAETGRPGKGNPGDPATRLERMRRACQAAAEILAETGRAIRPGITTDELDAICHDACIARGGYPSPLGYRGFPKSLCTSVNEVVVHGIPDDRPLENGDIVNLDVTIYLDGMHGDCNATFAVGEIDEASKRLIEVTHESLMKGIEAVKPGLPINVIGRAIEQVAAKHGMGVVRDFCGHGIGEVFHTSLQVSHYYEAEATDIIEEGMFFTIEPMLTLGDWRCSMWSDNWTAVTVDGKRSAQFEHTIHVTKDGAEILTLPAGASLRASGS